MTLLAYLAAYAPEVARWLRPRRAIAPRERGAEGETDLRPEASAAAAACANGDPCAGGGAQDGIATRRTANAGAGAKGETASHGVNTLRPDGQEAGVRGRGKAGAPNGGAGPLKPCRDEASRAAARRGGGAGGGGALLDRRTLRPVRQLLAAGAGALGPNT